MKQEIMIAYAVGVVIGFIGAHFELRWWYIEYYLPKKYKKMFKEKNKKQIK